MWFSVIFYGSDFSIFLMLYDLTVINPYAGGGYIWPIQNDAKSWRMSETLACGHSSESTP